MKCLQLVFIFLLFLVTPIVHASDAPFGLKWGMTKEEIEKMGVVLKKPYGDNYHTKSLPKNLEVAHRYELHIDERHGLDSVFMLALANDKNSKIIFQDITDKLTNKYGPASISYDESFLKDLIEDRISGVKRINVFNLGNQGLIELDLFSSNEVHLRYDSPDFKPIRDKMTSAKFDDLLTDFKDMMIGKPIITKTSIQFLNEDMVFLKSDLYSMAMIFADTSKLSREDRKYLLNNCQKNICPGTFYGRVGNVMFQKKFILEKIEWSDTAIEPREQESNKKTSEKYSVFTNTSEDDILEDDILEAKGDNAVVNETINHTTNESSLPDQNTSQFTGYIYFASEKPPVGKDIPPESPFCYRFKVASIEEQLEKLQKKYGNKFNGVIENQVDGNKVLTGRLIATNEKTTIYRYFTNPNDCTNFQTMGDDGKLASTSHNRQITCDDFIKDGKYSDSYSADVQYLGKLAGLHYISNHDGSIVNFLCSNDIEGLQELYDSGLVELSTIGSFKKILGLNNIQIIAQRSKAGNAYESAYNSLVRMGMCLACASVPAQEYANNPESVCAKLVQKALNGDRNSFNKLDSDSSPCE